MKITGKLLFVPVLLLLTSICHAEGLANDNNTGNELQQLQSGIERLQTENQALREQLQTLELQLRELTSKIDAHDLRSDNETDLSGNAVR